MVLRKDEFKNFVQFKKLHHFTKTHAGLCDGQFEDVWTNGSITKKRCLKCGTVAFVDSRTLNRGVIEGYIRREMLGLEPTKFTQDRHNYKHMNHCISCGEWFKSHTKDDLCTNCHTVSSGESGLDYDEFYHDTIELWQQGQKQEVGSDGDRPVVKKVKQYRPSHAILKLHIGGWVHEGLSETDIRKKAVKWLKPQSASDHMRIDALIQDASKRHMGASSPTSTILTTDDVIKSIRAMLVAHIGRSAIIANIKRALNCSDEMVESLIRRASTGAV